MSGPFSAVASNGQPSWITRSSTPGNFLTVTALGSQGVDEVGYGEGGYGQDGYDAISSSGTQAAPTPIWTVEVVR